MTLLADQQWIPGLVVGLFLVGLSVFCVRSVVSAWQRHRNDPGVNPRERDFYGRQYRRRLQVGLLFGVIGIMIPVGDYFIERNPQLQWLGWYWLLVLVLTFWVLLLGFADLLAIRSHHMPSLHSLKDRQRALQARVAELKAETERMKQSGSQSN